MLRADGTLAGSIIEVPSPVTPLGFITGGSIAADGTKFARSDVQGGWRLLPGADRWELMVSANVIPADQITFRGIGCWDVAVARSDATRAAMFTMAGLFVSTNFKAPIVATNGAGGVRFNRVTGLGAAGLLVDANGYPTHGANDPSRTYQRHMEFDPANADSLWISRRDQAGLTEVTNLGGGAAATVTHKFAAQIPAPDPAWGSSIAFDRSSAVIGGKTSRIFVHVSGVAKLFVIDQIAATVSEITGAPAYVRQLRVNPVSGVVMAIDHPAGAVWRYAPGVGWTTPTTQYTNISGIGFDTVDPQVVRVVFTAGQLAGSTDGGVTFSNFTPGGFPGTVNDPPPFDRQEDIPLLEWTDQNYLANGGFEMDPTNNSLWFWTGIGVSYVLAPPTGDQRFVYRGLSKGIGNLVGVSVSVEPTTGDIDLACHDRPMLSFRRADPSTLPLTHGPNNDLPILHATTSDYAFDNPNYRIFMANSTVYHSYDRGVTWTALAYQPINTSFTANIACGTVGNAMMLGVSDTDRTPQFCADFGPWQTVDFGSATLNSAAAVVRWNAAYFLARQVLVSSKEVANRFYAYCIGETNPANLAAASHAAIRGVWRFDIAGSICTATRVYDKLLSDLAPNTADDVAYAVDYWNAKLTLGPGGSAFFTPGQNDKEFAENPVPMFFTPNIDAPNSWIYLAPPWPTEVRTIEIGAAAPGALYPALLLHSEQHGYYLCTDFNPAQPLSATWQLLFKYPQSGVIDLPIGGAGDGGMFGRFYFSGGNTGIVLTTDYRHAVEWDS